MTAVTVCFHTNKVLSTCLFVIKACMCHKNTHSFARQPTVTDVMWIICMTTKCNGCRVYTFLTDPV